MPFAGPPGPVRLEENLTHAGRPAGGPRVARQSRSQTTREHLVRTAHDLFYQRGFHAVGLDQILAEVGVTKTTFYNHFSSKEDLIVEVLRWHDRWWRDTFLAIVRRHGGDTPRGQLMAIFDALHAVFAGTDYNGCIFINVAVQFPTPHDPAHIIAAEHKKTMESLVRELAGYAGATDPGALAQEIALLMEGAFVTAQITGDPHITDAAKRALHRAIEHYIPPPVAG